MFLAPSELASRTRAAQKFQHASTLARPWNDTLKLLEKLGLRKWLREFRRIKACVWLHLSKAASNNDGKSGPLLFYRLGKLEPSHLRHCIICNNKVDRLVLP